MNTSVYSMALQLSMQDVFSSSWFANALMNKAWSEILRSSVGGAIQATQSNALGQALGGRLRGDAAMLRQASHNVGEAQSMMELAAASAGEIGKQVEEAHKLVGMLHEEVAGLDPDAADYASRRAALVALYNPKYRAIDENINNLLRNAKYNGISLLDGSAWARDERLTLSLDDANRPLAATVHIQAGKDGFPLHLDNMQARFGELSTKHELVKADGSLDPDSLTALQELQNTAASLADFYAGRAGSLKAQASSLSDQAKVLDAAAAERAASSRSPHSLMLEIVLRDSGGLLNTRG